MSPLSARPGTPEGEARRARIVVLLVVVGISASLLAYAIAPGVRHAVGHAAHSVKRAVVRVFDRDEGAKPKRATTAKQKPAPQPKHRPAHARSAPPRTPTGGGAASAGGG
ncbi:MAG TPA: hypothetical protein VHT27_04930 [Solirubrobacteraceae bacterium]|nr:hypothetical protein [Solirubrobacteraceae bacterium]